ncbi:iron-sulfur cluster insertion protein ErpA [Buchnera aphidicola]|uniref:iron-sulfur cluster insertion protein ErpA n=1 Tax=Buchnera aphidicola TaxID=9 RepID=UPI0031B84BC8
MKKIITITKKAKKKINNINKKKRILRIYIKGGGCNGFQYKFKLEKKIKKNDIIIKKKKTLIIIDKISINYLNKCKIDYLKNLEGSKFIINNPNAKNTCSCGSSFNI